MSLKQILPITEQCVALLLGRTKHQNEEVGTFIDKTILVLNPIALMNVTELENLSGYVFRNVTVRDFVMELTFQLQARFALELGEDFKVGDLVGVLCKGLTLEGPSGAQHNLVPEAIKSRVIDLETIYHLLRDNTWLISCVLLSMVDVAGVLRARQGK